MASIPRSRLRKNMRLVLPTLAKSTVSGSTSIFCRVTRLSLPGYSNHLAARQASTAASRRSSVSKTAKAVSEVSSARRSSRIRSRPWSSTMLGRAGAMPTMLKRMPSMRRKNLLKAFGWDCSGCSGLTGSADAPPVPPSMSPVGASGGGADSSCISASSASATSPARSWKLQQSETPTSGWPAARSRKAFVSSSTALSLPGRAGRPLTTAMKSFMVTLSSIMRNLRSWTTEKAMLPTKVKA
mmetsp:Transcript_85417/g.276607  ORF Transcript_85417/g.276607 Transcript_85417/m.276607 type:complete len:241 (+) Transcript_85417:817-1539(+)